MRPWGGGYVDGEMGSILLYPTPSHSGSCLFAFFVGWESSLLSTEGSE